MNIVECPRDAMQGLPFIPTQSKIEYINQLLLVGFDTLDCGSFVSPKVIPQMRDTPDVIQSLHLENTQTKILVIVPNLKGTENAISFPEIDILGYPLSISESFQKRNVNKSIAESLVELNEIHSLCQQAEKKLIVYLSMGFGNPYGEEYNPSIVENFVKKLENMGITSLSLADTIGVSTPKLIQKLCSHMVSKFPNIEWGVHLHSESMNANEKIKAAYYSGCKRIDGAIRGFGGCPMSLDRLVGNIATEQITQFFQEKKIKTSLNLEAFEKAIEMSHRIF